MHGIVDRIEGGFAVVESGGNFINVPLGIVRVKEGDAVEFSESEILSVNKSETEKRKKEADALLKKLFGKNK